MRILAVTNMYPTPKIPFLGTFVEQQIKGLRQIGLTVEVLYVNWAQEGIREYLSLGRRLRSRCKTFRPDVVHVMYGGILAYVVTGAVGDRPTVVSFCGSDLLGEQLSGHVRKLISGCGILASHRSAKRANGVIVKSKNLRDALPGTVDPSKVRIIPNGINLDRFKPLDRDACRNLLGWEKDFFHVLFPQNSTGDPRKRLGLAQAALEAVNRCGIQVKLHQLKRVPHVEVPIWLNASDVVLLTSLHEGSPNIIKEALACDLPIVSVDVGDVRERIDGIEGCYLGLSNSLDLATKLCLVHEGQRRIKGRVTMEELSLSGVALRLKEFYEELLVSSGKKLVVNDPLM